MVRRRELLRALVALVGLVFGVAAIAQTPGVTASSIRIGQSAALSGAAAELGTEMRQGIEAYFATVNAAGGVNGRSLELVSLDDGYEPDRAAQNTRTLIEDEQVFALLGYVGTPTSEASLPIFTEARVPFVGAFTGAELLRDPFNRYIFNVRASYYQETGRIVDHLVAAGTTRIAVFHQNDSYGRAGLEGVRRAMERHGLEIHAVATVERNSTDVAEATRILTAAEPVAIIQISAYASCAALIKAMQDLRVPPQFFNVSFVGSRPLAQALGDAGRGVIVSQVVPFPFSGVSPLVRAYREAMERQGTTNLSFTSMEGFLAAMVTVEGLRRSGEDLTREGFVRAMETIRGHDFGGFVVTFTDSNHNGSDFVDLTMISRDGRFIR